MIIKVDIKLWMKFEKERRIGRVFECKLHNGRWKGVAIATSIKKEYERLLQSL
jgi:hypothetical protein